MGRRLICSPGCCLLCWLCDALLFSPAGGSGRSACRRRWAPTTSCCTRLRTACSTCPSSSAGTSSGSAQVCGELRALCQPVPCPFLPLQTSLLAVRSVSVTASFLPPSRGGVCHGDNSNRVSDQNQGGSGNQLHVFWDLLSLHHLPLHM